MHDFNGGAQFSQDHRGDLVRRPVSTIDDDFETLKVGVLGQGTFDELNIPAIGVIDSVGLPNRTGSRSQVGDFIRHNQCFHPGFEVIG